MKKGALILFILFSYLGYTQSKEQLIKAIMKINSLDDEPDIVNFDFNEKFYNSQTTHSNNYYNFDKLKKIISKNELIELTHHKNCVLRLYAIRELISQNDKSLDVKQIILNELNKKQKVDTQSGCIVTNKYTYYEVYHDYWNQVRRNALEFNNPNDENERNLIMSVALINDSMMMEVNKALINLNEDIDWLIYKRIFDEIKYDEKLNDTIQNLVYKYNNSYAFKYLKANYLAQFSTLEKNYYTNYFPKAVFKTDNSIFYLFDFTKHSFETNNKEYIDMVLKKLRENDFWKRYDGWFNAQIFEKYNVKI